MSDLTGESPKEKTIGAVQAGNRLGVSARTIQRWFKKGKFPNAYRIDPDSVNGTIRIPISDIEAIEERRRQ